MSEQHVERLRNAPRTQYAPPWLAVRRRLFCLGPWPSSGAFNSRLVFYLKGGCRCLFLEASQRLRDRADGHEPAIFPCVRRARTGLAPSLEDDFCHFGWGGGSPSPWFFRFLLLFLPLRGTVSVCTGGDRACALFYEMLCDASSIAGRLDLDGDQLAAALEGLGLFVATARRLRLCEREIR